MGRALGQGLLFDGRNLGHGIGRAIADQARQQGHEAKPAEPVPFRLRKGEAHGNGNKGKADQNPQTAVEPPDIETKHRSIHQQGAFGPKSVSHF